MSALHGVHTSPLITMMKSVFFGAGVWLNMPMPTAMKNSMLAFWICNAAPQYILAIAPFCDGASAHICSSMPCATGSPRFAWCNYWSA